MEQIEAFILTPAGIAVVVVGGWVLVGAVILAIITLNRRAAARHGEAAAARGWQYRKESVGQRTSHFFSGAAADDTPWQLEVTRISSGSSSTTGSSNVQTYLRWWTDTPRLPDGAVLVGPRVGANMPPGFDLGGRLAQFVLEKALRDLPGAEPGDAQQLAGLKPVEVGTETLRDAYSVFATDEEAARSFVSGAEPALIDWSMQGRWRGQTPRVTFWQRGLSVLFDEATLDFARLDQIVDLGRALAQAARQG